MIGALALLALLAAAPTGAERTSTAVRATPAAAELFERDWVLMNWALKFYDPDRDILLEPGEARAAASNSARSPTAMATGACPRPNTAPRGRSSWPAIERKKEGQKRASLCPSKGWDCDPPFVAAESGFAKLSKVELTQR